jgi:hypothetical protein
MPAFAPIARRIAQFLPGLALFSMLCAPEIAQASAAMLRAKHSELQQSLASNPFRSPVHLVSNETADGVSGSVYAVINQPFAAAGPALERPATWCEILFLHHNTKYCRAAVNGNTVLNVALGKKYDQPLEDAFRVDFAFSVLARARDYLQLSLNADRGPLSTRNYRIVFEATPLDAARTFIHLTYAYEYGFTGKLAMQVYLGTAGASKVGFTVVGTQPDGTPKYIGGMRGVVERNTMRYYLAIESHLGALSAPPQARIDKSLRDWHAATERYARQLHELGQAEYLEMKRREYQRQS